MAHNKLLIVSTSFPMIKGDGLSPFIFEFCYHLSRKGWDVTALVPHHRGLPDREVWDGVTVRRFRYLPEMLEDVGYSGGIMPNIKKRPWRVLKLPFYIFAMYREALRICEEEQIDLVNFQWLFPAFFWLRRFSGLSGLPIVLTGHGTDILLSRNGVFRKFADRAMPKADALTVNSNYMKSQLQGSVLPPRVEVICMGADGDIFRPGEAKPSDSKTILYVGRLIKQKGIDLLVEAFVDIVGQIPGARLEIIGYGPEKETIQTIVRTNHLEKAVTMIETVPHDELAQVYRRSRVLMLPALIPEGLGMTAAEAGLCGVPTITFGLGGTKEIVLDGRTGLIVEPDREALRDALMRIMTDGELADELGRNARLFLSDAVAWPKIASRFDSLFREILQAHGNPANRRGIIPTLIIALVTFGYMVKAVIDRLERILSIFK